MAYIIVTTDNGKVAWKERLVAIPYWDTLAREQFLDRLGSAVIRAEAHTARQKRLKNARSKT